MKTNILKNSISIALILILVLVSCNKEASYPYKFSGVWQIDKIEIKYYSQNGNVEDSFTLLTDVGTMILKNNTDSYTENEYQSAQLLLPSPEKIPPGIADFYQRAGISESDNVVMNYAAGPHGTERLTLWKELSSLHELIIFTVPKLKRKEMELSYHTLDSTGNLKSSEFWYCSIKN